MVNYCIKINNDGRKALSSSTEHRYRQGRGWREKDLGLKSTAQGGWHLSMDSSEFSKRFLSLHWCPLPPPLWESPFMESQNC